VFTGSAATGGFLGASLGFAFNRGVNRGLFSNEAGQGSAPIAHASARTKEPVSEGVVALLEPFIDTILICTLTGLVILSSGVWKEKLPNDFQDTELIFLDGTLSEANEADRTAVGKYLNRQGDVDLYTGPVEIVNGEIQTDVTTIHARSFAENVLAYQEESLFNGTIQVEDGKLIEGDVLFRGESLTHSAPLTAYAFTKGFLGDYGKYIITLGLLLFAFSTVISWSYYGDRCVVYLVGTKGITIFRIIYVLGFFVASFTDTKLVWIISGIAVALTALPNIIGLFLLSKDVKNTIEDYEDRVIDGPRPKA
jgi:AGCS family alanine or glycine:cation symporter